MPRAKVKPATLTVDAPPEKARVAVKGSRAGRPMNLAAARAGISTASKATAALVDPDKPLTAAQIVFVKGWAAGESISTATMRAGYNEPSYGYRMSVMPNVLKAYHAEKVLYEEASGMTRKKVMDMLLDAYADAKMVNEPASMVSAAREIGKMCGYYEPTKIKIDVTHHGNRSFQNLSDAELLELISQAPTAQPVKQLSHE